MESERPNSSAEIVIDADIERVFSVLSDPWSYGYWVVGSDHIRDADKNWPRVGSEFKHVAGVWPLKSHDHSYVEAVDGPEHLQLRVKARPFITARVWLDLTPQGKKTSVEMYEGAADPLSKLALNRVTQPLVKLRNEWALRRLRDLAEGRKPMPTPDQN